MAGTDTAEWAIEASGLTKVFGSTRALRGIDLRVRRGEALALFGPNGAGKTTLLRILAGLARPSSGWVRIDGLEVWGDGVEVRQRMGVVSHQTYLYDDLTADENLRFYGRMYDVPHLDQRISAVLAQVGLTPWRYQRVRSLSRGMQQRLSIARAVIHEPTILLLDEPDTGLDQQAAEMFRELLAGFVKEGRTAVMTSHNLERGLEVCHRLALVVQGRIVHEEAKGSLDVGALRRTYHYYTGAKS